MEELSVYGTNLTVVATIGDGSCFFHAICHAMSKSYRKKSLGGKREHVRTFRKKLSEILGKENNFGVRPYDTISNGKMKELSKSFVECSVGNMVSTLKNPRKAVSNLFNEFISNCIDKDIYLVRKIDGNIYYPGTDTELLIKGRQAIIILVSSGHYELLSQRKEIVRNCTSCEHCHIISEVSVKFLFDCRDKVIVCLKNALAR